MQHNADFYAQLDYVAGVDEVGRGPLAGPVVTAAVILDKHKTISGLADSKRLPEARREELAVVIKNNCVAWALGRAEVEEIDRLNILQATMLAMQRAVCALSVSPNYVLVDGNRCPELPYPVEAVIGGDGIIPVISAASIIAKVARDHEMKQLHDLYPGYGLDNHKGYPTKAHLTALQQLGVSEIHRRSFAPVKKMLKV